MPRKPKIERKTITISVDGKVINAKLIPPTESRKSWYVYWKGIGNPQSTGQSDFEEAAKVVDNMLRNGGRKSDMSDLVLSDEEFDEMQRQHYGKAESEEDKKRAERSLVGCMEAITAFRLITKVEPISLATPDDCERFQKLARKLPKNWRNHDLDELLGRDASEQDEAVELLSPSTIVKWTIALKAAFQRANVNAGQKCVRGVVPSEKLLTSNPWHQFTSIKPREREKRRLTHEELMSLLDYFEKAWPGLTFAPAFVKVLLWSWGRREEISSLQWSQLREVGQEKHFDSTGKWGVRKWFRLPENLFKELQALKNDSPYVFGCYPDQLREVHLRLGNKRGARRVSEEFRPENVGDWMYRQVSEWSKTLANGTAYLHCFRKTSLQHARRGEDASKRVAEDASLTESVMMASYADETDEELWNRSNRTYRRLIASLPLEVAVRYGYEEKPEDRLVERLDHARGQQDWNEVLRLTQELIDLSRELKG